MATPPRNLDWRAAVAQLQRSIEAISADNPSDAGSSAEKSGRSGGRSALFA
jgi:hypothetical protein